ncbi:SAM-dependent methyltransferase [Nitrosococcus wardiae]|uniref:SAM-dependent methyltransferase n=1 Tax=Nitrosococcus wardiae TaxID=1814290 RepID=UPI001F10C4BE|nr:cyclopropane-fatty-acyl-phospholipid synthase family protein [Nitrosococcus wardiae]
MSNQRQTPYHLSSSDNFYGSQGSPPREGKKLASIATTLAINLTEQARIPDVFIRYGIRGLLRKRLGEIQADDCEAVADRKRAFIEQMNKGPIAALPEKANEQHYELPPAFFEYILGQHLKYSCCYWADGIQTLGEAEAAALNITCERAQLEDGLRILELGCGWGGLSLWMAALYPRSTITAVSNSHSQSHYIRQRAEQFGLSNLEVITADMNDFSTQERFDRIVSVEMFEHMRNYRWLLARIHHWLKPSGKFFMHIFCHRDVPYAFEDQGPSDWMGRYFFSGGMMPSDDLPLHFQEHLRCIKHWRWDGRHYERTANAWLANMETHKDLLLPILAEVYGQEVSHQWWMRGRIFFMACAELFGYEQGQQWWVSHYLFERPAK